MKLSRHGGSPPSRPYPTHVAKILGAALLLFATAEVRAQQPVPSHLPTVERFLAAFNAHDSGAMAALVTADIEWFSVNAERVTVETRGRAALVASMDTYFKSCPTCQSTLAGTLASADRVSAVEIASWTGKTGPRSQRSLSVYEFSNGLIRRVYFFPAEQ